MSLSPSQAARRIACPGSHTLIQSLPKTDISESAQEGITAHTVACAFLTNPPIAQIFLKDGVAFGSHIIKELGIVKEFITDEMVDGAVLYTSTINEKICGNLENQDTIISKLHVEEPLDISNIHPECRGVPDCWAFTDNTLYLWEYKYGHKPVEVYENWQLIEYAAGILRKLETEGILNTQIFVEFSIIQPRSFHSDGTVRTWRIKAFDLLPYFTTLKKAEHEATQPNTLCTPNPECRFCPARHMCGALQIAALTAVDVSKTNSPVELSASALGGELRLLQHAKSLLDARITGLEEQALARIKRGELIPFYCIQESTPRKVWNKSIEEIINMGELLGYEIAKPREIITPKQAIDRGMPSDVIEGLTKTERGALKLKPFDLGTTKKIFDTSAK